MGLGGEWLERNSHHHLAGVGGLHVLEATKKHMIIA